ncbi:hypothetical protein Pelo_2433 [Pelomyxa schiedti]|nr:hypothetical protein Pelo_2433 [Pelomyxa schiedti]
MDIARGYCASQSLIVFAHGWLTSIDYLNRVCKITDMKRVLGILWELQFLDLQHISGTSCRDMGIRCWTVHVLFLWQIRYYDFVYALCLNHSGFEKECLEGMCDLSGTSPLLFMLCWNCWNPYNCFSWTGAMTQMFFLQCLTLTVSRIQLSLIYICISNQSKVPAQKPQIDMPGDSMINTLFQSG